ncbi:uncharacterized protein si:dkey-61p9.7 [Myxocyprinus asiaticus]|uniref:uncharacterized protein si:dkey-61p9.7 n=1 Tax=Myxocyprinus asiaticus TaxID=70543 RepID=UPI0022215CBB|nr:uncharacterized protein si:dkey-61p9.7 [Myxocyprinus asiaticus]
MTVEVTAEMGSSGALTKDITNPCRESELRKMYAKLRVSVFSEYMMEIREIINRRNCCTEKKGSSNVKGNVYQQCSQLSFLHHYHELGYCEPDPLSKLADKCYYVGCLMALHNPPLQLDWESKDRN